jgi:hypothetical protein
MLDPAVLDLFERAFCTRTRTTSCEWRTSLDVAMRQLVRCKNDPKHAYLTAAGSCPWCELIAVARLMFFVPSQGAAATNFRLEDIQQLIKKLSGMALAFGSYARPRPTSPVVVSLPAGLRSVKKPIPKPYPAPPASVHKPALAPLPLAPPPAPKPPLLPLPPQPQPTAKPALAPLPLAPPPAPNPPLIPQPPQPQPVRRPPLTLHPAAPRVQRPALTPHPSAPPDPPLPKLHSFPF